MNITSYNVTDVAYHYIGLRVLEGLGEDAERSRQSDVVSSNVRKFVTDKALRLMLPEPRGTFQAVGAKVCQELVHLGLARSGRGKPYQLTDTGRTALALLSDGKYTELRRLMVSAHLKAYDNLRAVVITHIERGAVWQPIVTASDLEKPGYLSKLLEPTFGAAAGAKLDKILDQQALPPPSQIEDALRSSVLKKAMPCLKMRVALFRGMCDRLVSLRLLNKPRVALQGCEFEKTYSPCVADNPAQSWYIPLIVPLDDGEPYRLYLSEPDSSDPDFQTVLLSGIQRGMSRIAPQAGYHDIPDLRDTVCEDLMIPEATFDDGLNRLLDKQPAPLSVGLQYERITGRRRPLVRTGQSSGLHNLIRRV